MTPSEELRHLLDEAGEHYETSGDKTWWGRTIDARTGKPINVYHYKAQPMGEDRLFVELQLATPEQAIAATVVDAGTCKFVWEESSQSYVCDHCENAIREQYEWDDYQAGHGKKPLNFCPNCGKRVEVGE